MSKYTGTGSMMAGKALAFAVQLFAVRLYREILGDAGYGAYVYVGTIVLFVMLIDPGWGSACTRRISQLGEDGRERVVREVMPCNSLVAILYGLLSFVICVALGLFLTIPDTGYDRVETLLVFVAGGFNALMYFVQFRFSVLLQADERFDLAGIYMLIASCLTVPISLLVLVYWKSPAAILLSVGVGYSVVYVLLSIWYRKLGHGILRSRWSKDEFFKIIPSSAKEVPSKISNTIGNSADRLIVGTRLGVAATGDIANAGSVAQAVEQTLQPVLWNALPRLSKEHEQDRDGFRRLTSQYTRFCLCLAAALILIPAAFGGAFLRIWLGPFYPAAGAAILLGMGIYRLALFSSMAYRTSFFAAGRNHLYIYFTALNATATLGLTLPFVALFGLVGVGVMNALIGAAMFVMMPFVVIKALGREFVNSSQVRSFLTVLGVSLAIAAAAYWVTNYSPIASYVWLTLALGPFWMLGTFVLLIRLGCAEVPRDLLTEMRSRKVLAPFATLLDSKPPIYY